MSVNAVIREDVQAMASYHVPDAAGLIKLDAMENPFGLPPALAQSLGQRLAAVAINRYPSPRPAALLAKLRDAMAIPAESGVLLGNGSDELISMISVASARPGAKVLAPVPGFVMYHVAAQLAGLEFVGVPLADDFTLDRRAMLQAIEDHAPALIYLAYPNNPTGVLFDDADIEAILQAAPRSLVIIDEAYEPFAQRSWLQRLPQYPNLAVLRTLSKLGLAGLRLGFLVAAPAWIEALDKVRPPYNVNVLTQASVEFLLDHLDVFEAQSQTLLAERARLFEALSGMSDAEMSRAGNAAGAKTGVGAHGNAAVADVRSFPSAANFILFRVPDADAVHAELLQAGILIKNVSKMHPLLANCLRLTVGTPAENEILINAMRQALAARSRSVL